MIICPCKDCKDRVLGCHSKCAAYLSYKEDLDSVRVAARAEAQARAYQAEAAWDNYKRTHRRR